MHIRTALKAVAIAATVAGVTPAFAETGAATGNGTSTPAGPAGSSEKMGTSTGTTAGGAMSKGSMSDGSMMKSGKSMMKNDSGVTANGISTPAGPAGKIPNPANN